MATHCYVTYCDVAHLLWRHKRLRHYSKPACTRLKCPPKALSVCYFVKGKAMKVITACDRKKMTKLLAGLTHRTSAVPGAKATTETFFQLMKELMMSIAVFLNTHLQHMMLHQSNSYVRSLKMAVNLSV